MMKTCVAALLLSLVCFVPTTTAATSWVEITKDLYQSVVRLTYDNNPGVCSGSVIDVLNKQVQTADHCIGTGVTYVNDLPASVMCRDTKNDLAVLEVPELSLAHKALKLSSVRPEAGEEVLVMGYADGLPVPRVRAGIVSMLGLRLKKGGTFTIVDTPYIKGMSGGPAVNVNGEAIGVIAYTSETDGLSVDIDILRKSCGGMWASK